MNHSQHQNTHTRHHNCSNMDQSLHPNKYTYHHTCNIPTSTHHTCTNRDQILCHKHTSHHTCTNRDQILCHKHTSSHLYQQGPNPVTSTRCISTGQNLHSTPQQARKTIIAKIGDKICNLWNPDPQTPGSKQHHLLHITSTFGFQIRKHLLHISSPFGFQIHKHLARTLPFKHVIFTTTSDAGCTDSRGSSTRLAAKPWRAPSQTH